MASIFVSKKPRCAHFFSFVAMRARHLPLSNDTPKTPDLLRMSRFLFRLLILEVTSRRLEMRLSSPFPLMWSRNPVGHLP